MQYVPFSVYKHSASQPLPFHVLLACTRQWQARRKNGTCRELRGFLGRRCYWLARSPRSTYAVTSASSVRVSCYVLAFIASGQGRMSNEDPSVTVSGVTGRGSFDQCVSYTECVIKTLASERRA
jgi:hypothetical protein